MTFTNYGTCVVESSCLRSLSIFLSNMARGTW
jgi:hypothetical protein